MNVLVLGGSYFVGAAIAAHLVNSGHEVVVANRGSRAPPDLRIRQFVYDRSLEGQRLPAVEAIVDVSCYNARDARMALGALAALPARYVFISSAAVYGPLPPGKRHVEGDPTPGDPIWGDYGTEKAEAEALLRDHLGDALTTLRPPYIYGPGNELERESFIWDRLFANRPVLIPEGGRARLQFCHSDDLAIVVNRAISGTNLGGVYNVGETRDYRVKDWVELLGAIAERPVRLVEIEKGVPARSYFPFRSIDLVLDTGAVQRTFGTTFRSLETGLRQTLDWFLCQNRAEPSLTEMERRFDQRSI